MVVRTAVARLYPAAAPQSLGQQQPQPAGLVMFRRDPEAVEVYSELSGLAPGAKYQLVIHQYGDIADDPAKGAGGIYSPEQTGPAPQQLLVVPGNLGMVEGGQDGRAVLKREVEGLLLNGPNSIVGRVVALHEVSPQTPEALGPIVAYGVIGVGNPLR
jgi:Cu/Zn superoxide dismutase